MTPIGVVSPVGWRRAENGAAQARLIAHAIRWVLLEQLEQIGEASPSELAEALERPLGTISYHMRALHAGHVIQVQRVEQRRGAIESYYVLTSRGRDLLKLVIDPWPR